MGAVISRCACILMVLVAGCQSADLQPPAVSLSDIRMLQSGLLEQRFALDLRITNPNNTDVALDGLSFDLILNDANFASGVSNEQVVLPRLGETVVSIESHTSLLQLVEQAMVLAEAQTLTYRLQGNAFLSGFGGRTIPFQSAGALRLAPDDRGRTLVPRAPRG